MKCLKKQKVILAVLLLLLTSLLAISGSMPIIQTVETFFELHSHEHSHKNGNIPHHHSFDFKGSSSQILNTNSDQQLTGGSYGTGGLAVTPISSDNYPNTSAAKLFDNSIGVHTTGWHSNAAGSSYSYIQLQFTTPQAISKFAMIHRSRYNMQFPKVFKLYGSNTTPTSSSDVSSMELVFETDGTGYSKPTPNIYTETNAQISQSLWTTFEVENNRRKRYTYYIFEFIEPWGSSSGKYAKVIAEMMIFVDPSV